MIPTAIVGSNTKMIRSMNERKAKTVTLYNYASNWPDEFQILIIEFSL